MLSAISSMIFGKTSTKRQHDDSSSEPRPAKRGKTMGESTLRKLPLELRDEIYRCLLDDTIERPQHPYSDFPGSDGHAQFRDYLSLRLVDRGTSDEVKSVWEKEYAAQAVFYLEDAPALYRLKVMSKRIPYLAQTARFCLRCRSDNPECPGERDRINEDILMLVENQPGWEEEWTDEPGLLNEVLYEDHDELYFHIPDEDPWDANAHGFQAIDHDACERGKALGIANYQEVLYPVIQSSIQVRGFSWQLHWDQGERESGHETLMGCTFFEGRICDVRFLGYEPKRCAQHLIQHQWELKQLNSATNGKDYDEYRQRLRDLDAQEEEVLEDTSAPVPGWGEYLDYQRRFEGAWADYPGLEESEGDESSEESDENERAL